MAAGKEIRSKITSVENTKKITKAMEMVAASKMRKAQDRMRAARPYAEKVRQIAANLGRANPEYRHAFMQDNAKADVVGFIVVTTDKGLCGGMNTNILRAVTHKIKDLQAQGKQIEVVAIGGKGLGFMHRVGAKVVSQLVGLGDRPQMDTLIGPSKVLLYEPEPNVVIDDLLLRYVEAQIYQAVAENMASEQSARMVAMKAATDNAGQVIKDLKLVYNKTRQAAITKELSEIVAGAAAV
jgi:F-type H+-transporting ATPase subunit gamma